MIGGLACNFVIENFVSRLPILIIGFGHSTVEFSEEGDFGARQVRLLDGIYNLCIVLILRVRVQ